MGVQRGTASFATGDTVKNITITAVVLASSFVVISTSSDSFNGNRLLFRAHFTSTTNLRIERTSTTAAIDVEWEVVYFDQLSVQTVTATIADTFSQLDVAISAVDLSRTFVICSNQVANAGGVEGEWVTARLTSTTNLRLDRLNSSTDAPVTAFVITLPTGSTVQRGEVTWANVTTTDITITAVNLSRSFALARTRSNSSNGNISLATARLTTTTNLQLQRESTSLTPTTVWQVVELPVGSIVREAIGSMGSGVTSENIAISAVVLANSCVFATNRTPDTASTVSIQSVLTKNKLTTTTNVNLVRVGGGGTTHTVAYAVEFNLNTAPNVPTFLQRISESTDTTPVFQCSVSDPDSGQQIKAKFEIYQSNGVTFVGSVESAFRAGDGSVSAEYSSALPVGSYKVQAQTIDDAGASSAFTAQVAFDVTSLVSKDLILLWTVQALVNKDLILLWNVLQSNQKDLILLWNVYTPLSKDLRLRWGVYPVWTNVPYETSPPTWIEVAP